MPSTQRTPSLRRFSRCPCNCRRYPRSSRTQALPRLLAPVPVPSAQLYIPPARLTENDRHSHVGDLPAGDRAAPGRTSPSHRSARRIITPRQLRHREVLPADVSTTSGKRLSGAEAVRFWGPRRPGAPEDRSAAGRPTGSGSRPGDRGPASIGQPFRSLVPEGSDRNGSDWSDLRQLSS